MNYRFILALVLFLFAYSLNGQELYIHAEPASNIPKGVLGVRSINEMYQEGDVLRSMHAIRIMYGITPRFMMWLQPNVSNHHGDVLPEDLITHTHVGSQTIFHTRNAQLGKKYPYRFNGFHLYAKYLIIKQDAEKKHFRVALFAEGANNLSAHDEAEPHLHDDNMGLGGGVIATYLKNRLAFSLTNGFILPKSYQEYQQPDEHIETNIMLKYGRAWQYSLSMGYLYAPAQYVNYSQPNINLYVELKGKAYEGAEVILNNEQIAIESSALKSGFYLEIYPGIQKVIGSNTRLEFSVGLPLINRSYIHTYPLYTIQFQHYFYL